MEMIPSEEVITEELMEQEELPISWSHRLIVISGSGVRPQEHVLSFYEDLYLLGFENESELEEAQSYYSGLGAHAEKDEVISAAESEGDIKDVETEISSENNPIDRLQETLNEAGSPAGEDTYLVALIDTGTDWSCPNVISATSMLGEDAGDDNGHGSRMLGYLVEENPNVKVLSIKALDENGRGTVSSVYAAMEYAIEQGANLISLSASAYRTEETSLIKEEIGRASMLGIQVVGAAGNQGMDAKYFIPGGSEPAWIITSCNEQGVRNENANYGATVDWMVVSGSTSEAAARFSGILSASFGIINDRVTGHSSVFSMTKDEEDGSLELPEDLSEDFETQCNTFFYGDAYFWGIPNGATDTGGATLIPGYQQETLSAKTDTANGYGVQFQSVADTTFTPGHGYAVFASTHKENAVTSWTGSVHVNDWRGTYEAWGRRFNSSKAYTVSRKTIPGYTYRGMVVSQNKTAVPASRAVSSLNRSTSTTVKLGEEAAIYWDDIPGVNSTYWQGWAKTSSGTEYSSFRVDFYYEEDIPVFQLKINYLEEGSGKVLHESYGPVDVAQGSTYSVESPVVSGYEISNEANRVVSGTMPGQNVELTVLYRKVYHIDTKVINGKITLDNTQESSGTVGDDTYMAEGSVTDISYGTSRTIRYEPRDGYLLDYIKVDGAEINPYGLESFYQFETVKANHTIEVRYAAPPITEDAKQVLNSSGTKIDGQITASGELLTYQIKVKNTFSSKRDFHIEDNIPGGTEYVSGSATHSGSESNGTLKWTISLSANAEAIVAFQVKVKEEAEGTIVKNHADVSVNEWTFTTNMTQNPVLKKPIKDVFNQENESIDGMFVSKDEVLRYAITVENPADTAREFTILDPIDPKQIVKETSISDDGQLDESTILWIVSIPAGASKTVTFETTPTGTGLTIPNQAIVNIDSCEAETNRTVVMTPEPPVKKVKTLLGEEIDGLSLGRGEPFLYEVTVHNNASSPASCTLTDTVPDGIRVLRVGSKETGDRGTAVIDGREVRFEVTLEENETMTVQICCEVTEAGGVYENQAYLQVGSVVLPSNTVSNWSGQIVIEAETEEVYEPYGIPSFLYEIHDHERTSPWMRMIQIASDTKTGTAVFDIPTGHAGDTWGIRDLPGDRYVFVKTTPKTSNVSTDERNGSVIIDSEHRLGVIHYLYRIDRWDDTFHTDSRINSIHVE